MENLKLFHEVCDKVIGKLREWEREEKIMSFSTIRRDGNYQAVLFRVSGVIGTAASLCFDKDEPETIDLFGNSELEIDETREWHEIFKMSDSMTDDTDQIAYAIWDMLQTFWDFQMSDLKQYE